MKTAAEFNLAQIIASIAPSPYLERENSTPEPAGAQFAALLGAAVDVAALRESGKGLATFAETDLKDSPPLEPVIALPAVSTAVSENTVPERRVSVDEGLAITTVSFLSGRKVLVAPASKVDYPLEGVSSLPAWWSEQLPPLPAQSLSAAMALVHARSPATADPQNLPLQTSPDRTAPGSRLRRPTVQPSARAPLATADAPAPNPASSAESVRTGRATTGSKPELAQHSLERVESMETDDRKAEGEKLVEAEASTASPMTSPEWAVAATLVSPGRTDPAQGINAPVEVPPRVAVAGLPSFREALGAAADLRAGPQESWDEISPPPAVEGAPSLPAMNPAPVAAGVAPSAPFEMPPRAAVAGLPSFREALGATADLRAGSEEPWGEIAAPPGVDGAPSLPGMNATLVAAGVGLSAPIEMPPRAVVAGVQTVREDFITADRHQPKNQTSFLKPAPLSVPQGQEGAAKPQESTPEPATPGTLEVPSTAREATAVNRDDLPNYADSATRIGSSRRELGSLATSLNYDQSATPMAVATSTNSGLEVIDRPHMPAAPERTVPLRPLSRSEFADAVLRFAAFEVELPEKGGVSRMRLEVTPADLGHLDIEVRHEGDAIDVRITATDPSAVTTLRESEHIIRDLLSREEGGRVTVSIDVAAKDGSGGEGRGQRRGTEHQRSEGSEPETKLLKVRLRDSNQFDVYV